MTPQGIGAWLDLFNTSRIQNANKPYINDIAQAERDSAVGRAQTDSAQGQFAPQFYGSQAQDYENKAGISAIDLQYAPRMKEQDLQSGGLSNMLNQLKIQQAQRELNAPAYRDWGSEVGKLIGDREQIVAMYGAESPQAKLADELIQNKMKGQDGVTVYGPDGQPLVQMGGSGSGRGFAQGNLMNPKTREVYSPLTGSSQTIAQQAIAGSENLNDFLGEAIKYLPQFQSPYTRIASATQGLANQYLGGNFKLPAEQALGEAALKQTVEGFLATYNLPQAKISIKLIEDIFKPKSGEKEYQYRARLEKQKAHIINAANRRRDALNRGEKLTEAYTMADLDEGMAKETKDMGKAPETSKENNTSNIPTYNPKTKRWE